MIAINRKANVLVNTPMAKDLSALKSSVKTSMKTPLNNMSRKAFGNVSNVLSCKQTISGKVEQKSESLVKEEHKWSESSEVSKIGFNSNEHKVETDSNPDSKASKLMDELENMYPNEDELMSEVNDSITTDLFAIDEQTIFAMEFDSDMTQCLLPLNNGHINIDDLF